MNLDNIPLEELQAEIKRREKEKMAPPKQKEGVNIDTLRESCQSYIDSFDKNGYANEDGKQYIFEIAMECLYGCKIWDWMRKRAENQCFFSPL